MQRITNRHIIEYIIICVHEFAKKFSLKPKEAFNYLQRFQGLNYIMEYYDVEHLLSIDEAVEDLTIICHKNGGGITL